jgi:hypothetical protein
MPMLRLTRRTLLAGLGLPVLGGGAAALFGQLPSRSRAEISAFWRVAAQETLDDVTRTIRPTPFDGPINRLVVGGQPAFWAGLNYPWKTGQDFGTGGWGHSGVSDPTTYQEVDVDFTNMAARGVRVLKWRIFSDGRYGLQLADDGSVRGLDAYFLADLDAALEIAARHDIYLVFTLFSSGLWTADCTNNGVRLGGHAQTLLDARRRQALVNHAVVPMLQHIGNSDRVVAFEIIAEPEWGIGELNQEQDARIKLPLAVVRDFVGDVTRAIHGETRALATVESNRFSNMQSWQALRLDYYSFSWYDWLEPYEPLATPASNANLDRPLLLGEYPAGRSTYYDLPGVLDLAYGYGYAGAFAWSYWSGDGFGDWRGVAPSFAAWVRPHWNDTTLGGPAPLPTEGAIPEQRYPYTYQDLALRFDGNAVVAELKIDVASGEPYVPHAYLYQIGNADPLEDVLLTADPSAPGHLAARFTQVDDGTPYSISLGIFNRADVLRKWFDNMVAFAVSNGAITTPQVDTLAAELGCKA